MNRSIVRRNLALNLLYFLMVFSLVYVVGVVINLDLSFLIQIILAFALTMAVKFITKNTVLLYLSLIIVFIGGLAINSYITPIYPYFERVIVLFSNIYDHIFMNQLIESENILPFWILMTIIYSTLTSLVILKPREGVFSLLIIYLPLFIYYWYIYVNEAYFALAIFLFAYFVLRGLVSFNKEQSNVEPGLRKYFPRLSSFWSRTTAVYGILIVLIALMLPKSDDNIRWLWMEDQIASIVPRIEDMRSNDTTSRASGNAGMFNFATTGFQESPSQLGGPISPNDDTVMYVRSDEPTYLRGAVKHFYDGNAWASGQRDNSVTNHLLETNFSYIDYYEREEYYDERDIIIQFSDYASTTLFSPYMPIVVNADRGKEISLTEDHIMELSEGVYDGENYGVKALYPKPYYELLDSGIDNRYDDIENMNYYLQVPMGMLTQRTIDLKDEIISHVSPGRSSDYEKAVAIESYLRENYEYTLNTSPIPEGHEFIDYFLFEEQAGYCTYYATTMSIFLRLEGIPTRYVEGYIAHETVDGEIYEVRQSHAHAWVEAYIEPVGWITFEPTSAYPQEDRQAGIVDEVEEENVQDNDPSIDDNMHAEQDITADDDMGMDSDSDITNEEESSSKSRNIILVMLGIILLILPARFIVKIIRYHIDEYRIRKLSNDKKMLVIYHKLLEVIEKLGHPKKDGETHYEFANRIGHKFSELKPLTNIFVKNKYGDIMPSDEEIQGFVDYRKDLEEQLKNKLGKFRYYIRKY